MTKHHWNGTTWKMDVLPRVSSDTHIVDGQSWCPNIDINRFYTWWEAIHVQTVISRKARTQTKLLATAKGHAPDHTYFGHVFQPSLTIKHDRRRWKTSESKSRMYSVHCTPHTAHCTHWWNRHAHQSWLTNRDRDLDKEIQTEVKVKAERDRSWQHGTKSVKNI